LSTVGKRCIKAIRHIINWYWLISLPLQTDDTLKEALSHLVAFDIDKIVFAKADCSLALPKLHSLQHYDYKIKAFGTPDNFDTEYTENRHITDAKLVYKMTNKVDYEEQMVKHVHRRAALDLKKQYLDSLSMTTKPLVKKPVRMLGCRAPNYPVSISHIARQYALKDLEYCIQTYIHDCSYTEENGKRHRVKKQNLPQIIDPQVFSHILWYS
jgi:hypothetical protein